MKKNFNSYVSIFKQEGTSRKERFAGSLNPENIFIDNRRLEDFIIYAQQYSKNVLFVDTDENNSEAAKTWEQFFKDDLVLLSANIAKKDVNEIKADYDFLYDQFRKEESWESFSRIAAFVYSRFRKIDQWYASSSQESALNRDLNLYIRSYLARDFQKLNYIVLYLNSIAKDPDQFIKTDLINRNNIWETADKPDASKGAYAFEGKTERDKLYNALLFTNKIFDTVFHATAQIINLSRNFFEEEIYRNQNIAPNIALYITFVNLFGVVQKELNRVPGRILDFYYRDVLKTDPRKAVPDSAFVVFEIAKGFDHYRLEKGTKLLAGKDKKNVELIYKIDKEIVISKARVSALKAVSIDRKDELIINYFGETLKHNEKPANNQVMHPFSASGKDKVVQTGFAIASDQLYLAKGERNVVITFETKEDLQTWENYDVSILELCLTGEKGWISSGKIEDGIIINSLKKTGTRILELNFSITIAQPSAVVAYDQEIHNDKFNLRMPVLKVIFKFPYLPKLKKLEIPEEVTERIKQLNYLISLNILKTIIGVQVGSISEKVSFDGIRDLILENHDTELDSKKPFYPFTTMPKVGSSFYIGCKDLYYKKNIDNLLVSIDWMLPDNFESYYDKYFHPYDSNKFMASLSVLRNREWTHLKDVPLIEPNTDEPNFRLIKIPNKPRTAATLGQAIDVSKFDVSKKDGTLKLKLNYPDFGHDIYPQLVTSIAMEKANSKLARVDFYQIIQKELADSEISIKLPGPGDENYRINVVSDVLKNTEEKDIARRMIIDTLNFSITKFNGVNISSGEVRRMSMDPNRTIVNDDNFIERILRFLKKVKLIDKKIHFDRDKDSVDTIVKDVNEQLNTRIDFILPADEELVSLIISEVNNAIRRIVVKAADKIIDLKKAPFDENTITGAITKEIDVANEVINDMVARKIATLLSAHDIPPQPYTPLINSISLSYTSIKELNKNEDYFFHLLPFGIAGTNAFETSPVSSAESALIQTKKLFSGNILNADSILAGTLLIGIKDLTQNENLTLFFQIDQSSKLQNFKPSAINWWYLKNNEWRILKNDNIISDSTYGLQTTGIVEISVPSDLINNSTVFDEANLFWLGISVSNDPESFPGLIDVLTQATTVTFENNSNDPMHLAYPLPANKINRFEELLPGVKTIKQPVASFNGKIMETQPEFYSRVSERLRHKLRTINNWDYERLILEKFPSVFKVKCINNYSGNHFLPGHVTVVPIMSMKNKSFQVVTELPVASYLELRQIEEYVKQRCSAFIRIHAVNPQPNYVLINCKVKLRAAVDKGYYLHKLNEDLIKFLSPWTIDSDTPSFSTKIYASSIINFIDKKDYVDYVADLSMNQFTVLDDGTINYSRLENQTIALTETQITAPHAILVSAKEHNIELL